MTPGVLLMPLLLAKDLDSRDLELKLYQQPSLDRELDQFSLMTLDVLETKAAFLTAQL